MTGLSRANGGKDTGRAWGDSAKQSQFGWVSHGRGRSNPADRKAEAPNPRRTQRLKTGDLAPNKANRPRFWPENTGRRKDRPNPCPASHWLCRSKSGNPRRQFPDAIEPKRDRWRGRPCGETEGRRRQTNPISPFLGLKVGVIERTKPMGGACRARPTTVCAEQGQFHGETGCLRLRANIPYAGGAPARSYRGATRGRFRHRMESHMMDLLWEKPLRGNRTGGLIVQYVNGQCVPLAWATA